ncbi:hypothetical protein [Accumulibacter sp.]|uniref:hypothetical protein n=1 Tax=Accumulibacter sp. TaxID=2053492 RepID=UPI00338FBCD1
MISGSSSAREASELLIGRARSMGHGDGDNISVAILKLVNVSQPEPAATPGARTTLLAPETK